MRKGAAPVPHRDTLRIQIEKMLFLLRVLAVLCLAFAVFVGITLLQIEPSDQSIFDLFVACATVAALILSCRLLLQIAVALKKPWLVH